MEAMSPRELDNYKRKRSVVSYSTSDSISKTRSNDDILRNYSNFVKSGIPKQLSYYRAGEWIDHSVGIVDLLKVDFQNKKAVSEIQFNGQHLLFDFVHMVQIDPLTGLREVISWVDEDGRLFSPQALEFPFLDKEINLQVDESETSAQSSTCEENDYAVSDAKRLKGTSTVDYKEAVGENEVTPVDYSSLAECLTSLIPEGKLYSVVQDMLLLGLRQVIDARNIHGIYHIPPSSDLGQSRLKQFQIRVDFTKNRRGNANVRYGWMAASSASVKSIMLEGAGKAELPLYSIMHGVGIHLTPANRSNIRYF